MDKMQDFDHGEELESSFNKEQVIKEFQKQTQKFRPRYLHIPWNLDRIKDLDFEFDRDYFQTEETINYHLTLMLKITAMGGSQFLVENIVFSNIHYAILGQETDSTNTQRKLDLERKIELRSKIENWIYQFSEK